MDSKKCILVVDDNDAGRYATTRILKEAGFLVVEATTGHEALILVKEKKPHLVLLDVNLPDISGFDVCKAIKSLSNSTSTPVVHLSATYVGSKAKSKGLEGGADGYLVQPVEPRELVATLQAFLRLKETEEKLRLQEQEFRALAENLPDIVVRFNRDLTALYANPAIEREFRIPRSNVIGYNIDHFSLPEEIKIPLVKTLKKVVATGQGESLYLDYESPSGIKHYYCRIVPEFEDKRVERVLAISSDITILKERDEALEDSRAKSEFLTSISHELRTPLHAILSYSDIGFEESKSERYQEQRKYFKKIQISGRRLLHLINDLLDLSKIEARKMSYMFQKIELYEILQSIQSEMAPLLEGKSIKLELNKPLFPTTVMVDKERILQVLRNIIENAMKFSPRETTITASFFQVKDPLSVGIHIVDEGPGIPEEEMDIIFTKFTKGRLYKKNYEGTGLGLAISKEIIVAHQGQIYANNEPEKGARISIALPLYKEESDKER